jgi:hypothetical protein
MSSDGRQHQLDSIFGSPDSLARLNLFVTAPQSESIIDFLSYVLHKRFLDEMNLFSLL